MDADHPRKSPRLAFENSCVKLLCTLLPFKSSLSSAVEVNSYLGMAIGYLVLTVAYYTNQFNGRNLTWMSTSLFDRDGNVYNQTAILTDDFQLDHEKLAIVGPPSMFSFLGAIRDPITIA